MIEPTITQNSALYFAHHRRSKQRAGFFRRFGAAVRKGHPDLRQQRPLDGLFFWTRLRRDTGR